MEFKQLKNKCGIKKHFSTGGTFNEYRHRHTDYNDVCKKLEKLNGRSCDTYRAAARKLANDCLDFCVPFGRQNRIDEITNWLNTHG